ncbi:MAG TPA: heavy-metal-associated domain-containing protein [Thermoplasmata archaeon]|nr:heavy-metal-associated domain-containing protein [Thermoplasmata archaeon]
MSRVKYRISGMNCATCTRILEKALTGAPGINDVVANYMIDAAVVDFDPSKTSEELIRERIESRTSYRVRVVH